MGSPEYNEEQSSDVAEQDSGISHEDLSMSGTHGGGTIPYPHLDAAREDGPHGSGTEPKIPPSVLDEDI